LDHADSYPWRSQRRWSASGLRRLQPKSGCRRYPRWGRRNRSHLASSV